MLSQTLRIVIKSDLACQSSSTNKQWSMTRDYVSINYGHKQGTFTPKVMLGSGGALVSYYF